MSSEFWTRNLAVDGIKGCCLSREGSCISVEERKVTYHFSYLLCTECFFFHIFCLLILSQSTAPTTSFSSNTEFPTVFIFWNIFSYHLECGFIKNWFCQEIFLISLISFPLGSMDGFISVWCLFIARSCKARRKMYHFCSLTCLYIQTF